MSMDYSIEVKNLTKKFGDKLAVDNISFNVPKGKVTGFLGPNGAGKTTTMRCMLGLDNATSGEILLNGKKYINLQNPMHVVGAMIDATAFHKSRSAYNHLKFIADSIGEPKSRVDEVLEMTGLTSVAKKNAGKYSLGMGQRIGIAAALLGKPEILILDEPVNGLDPEGVKWVRDLCKGFAKSGRTVFISSHLMSEMEQTVDGLVILGRGKVLATGSLDDIKRLGGDGNESLEDAYMKLTESSVEYKTDFSAIPSLDSTSDSLALPKLQ